MSKIKVIFSIILLLCLIGIGIVLPYLWRQNGKKQADTDTKEPTVSQVDEEKKMEAADLVFSGFEKLKDFFAVSQIEDLKTQFLSYFKEVGAFKEAGANGITKVTFLPEKTTYPDVDTTLLSFALSDDTTLPVFYSASLGTFLFGEDKLQISDEIKTYERQTDDTLPSVTTEEIEARQEGGYADTKDNVPNETTKKTDDSKETTGNHVSRESSKIRQEVQP